MARQDNGGTAGMTVSESISSHRVLSVRLYALQFFVDNRLIVSALATL